MDEEGLITAAAGASLSWGAAFAFGVVAILFFAKERLDRPLKSDGEEKLHRERLFEYLRPFQLRHRDVFRKAYVMYTAALLLAYGVGSVFASTLGPFLVPGASFDEAYWPLGLALAMTGVAPSLPLLVRAEEWARAKTHAAVGVPRTFHRFTDALLQVRLDPASIGDDLIGPGDAERLALVLDAAQRVMGARTPAYDSFANRTMKLYAFRAWVDSNPPWPPASVRREFARIETVVTPPAQGLIDDLQSLAADTSAPDAASVGGDGPWKALESRWRAIARRVAESADDVCALFALYAERATEPPLRDNPISALLRDLIEQARDGRDETTPVADALLLAVGVVSAVAFGIGLAGALSGITAMPGASAVALAFVYFMGALVLYGPSGFIAWTAQHGRRWVNFCAGGQVFPARQYLGLLLRALAVSFAMMSLFLILNIAAAHLRGQGGQDLAQSVLVRQFLGIGSSILCGQNALVWIAVATAPMGAWNALHLALQADMAAARQERQPRAHIMMAVHALGLGAIHLVGSIWLGRLVPCTDFPATVAPSLGLSLNAAQEVVAFEVLTSILLGLVFSWQTRSALVALRDHAPAATATEAATG